MQKGNNFYCNNVVYKPWGYEYVIYNNTNRLAITFLKINSGHKTSLHCHPKKKTGFIILSGKAQVQIGIYKKNNRQDLSEVEEGEVQVLTSYLPKQLSEEETNKVCKETIKKIGANSIKDIGKIMGELKKNYSDNLDFSKAGSILKTLLNKQ